MKLSDQFRTGTLLKFALPSILMMIFTSIYGVVDGFFVSNFGGKTAFAAVNFIMPVIMILITPGYMIGSGGSALVAASMGEESDEKARKQFTLLTVFAAVLGLIIALLSYLSINPLLHLLGCTAAMWHDASLYAKILVPFMPFYLLQLFFQSFFVTAEKPTYGFYVTLACGLTNMALDWVFVGVLGWGVAGAAWATNIGVIIGGLVPLLYFWKKRSSPLYFSKLKWNGKYIRKACLNGSSEMLTNVSMSLVGILYNWQLLHYIGENGVSAYGVLMYVNMIFSAIFMGFTMGTAPILSYNYGAGRKEELKKLLKRSACIILVSSLLMFAAAEVLGSPLSHMFVGYDPELVELTSHAFHIYSFGFLFMGMAVYGSGFFTALNDGVTSAVISFFRTLVFQVAAVIIFPILLGVDGIWMSIDFAELSCFALVFLFLYLKRDYFGFERKRTPSL